ncbi:hypothetical protein D9M72_359940 [compost metagenome]
MYDSRPVAVLEGGEHAEREVDGVVDADFLRTDEIPQGLSGHEFHHDVRHADSVLGTAGHCVVPGVVDGNDRRMVQRGHGLGFALEPRLELWIPGKVRSQQLDGHCPAQPGVQAPVDVRHTAAADELTEFVPSVEDALGVHWEAVLSVRRETG